MVSRRDQAFWELKARKRPVGAGCQCVRFCMALFYGCFKDFARLFFESTLIQEDAHGFGVVSNWFAMQQIMERTAGIFR